MRKYFEGHSVHGVALMFLCFFLAVFLRFYQLDTQSPWIDEIASWFYLRQFDLFNYSDSHTPLYYGLLRLILGSDGSIFEIRLVSAFNSVFNLIVCFAVASKVFPKEHFLLFWVLICLNPIDISMARQARHYAWLLEAVLILWLWIRIQAPLWWLSFLTLMIGFIHLFALIPMTLMFLIERPKKFWVPILTSTGVLFYYFFRGTDKNWIAWNHTGTLDFLWRVCNQMLGDFYPRTEFENLGMAGLIIVTIFLVYFLWRKSKGGLLFVATFGLGLYFVEVMMFYVNFRIERYFIYLSGLLILGICDSVTRPRPTLAFAFLISLLYINNPLKTWPWLDEWISEFKIIQQNSPEIRSIVCAGSEYSEYTGLPGVSCLENLASIDTQKPLLILVLDDRGETILPYLAARMDAIKKGKRLYLLLPRS